MATSLYSNINVEFASTLSNTVGLAPVSAPLDYIVKQQLTQGTGASQADLLYSGTTTASASATVNLDLAGVLTGPLGATLTFARIKAVLFVASSANTNAVQVTSPASNAVPLFMGTTGGISLAPGAGFAWWDSGATGKVVTASTGDIIAITNSAGGSSVSVDVVIIGASA